MTSKIRNPTHIKIIIIKQILRHKILLLPHKITNRQTNSIKKTKKFQTPTEREREIERVFTCDKRIVLPVEPPKISVWGIKWQSVVERQSEAKWQSKESLKSERDEIERDHEVWSRGKTKFEEWEWEILRRLDVFEFERSVFWVIWTRGGLNWNRVQKTRFSVKLNRVQGLDFL